MLTWKIIPGLTAYSQGMAIMESHLKEVQADPDKEIVMLLEHEHIYTAGTGYDASELKNPGEIEVAYTGRGGKFTYHGPGQRIIYPIINLTNSNREKDLKKYIKDLENTVIASLDNFGIEAFVKEGMVGIWVNHKEEDKKIGAIGVRIQKWVTFHGIAVNISTDLEKFGGIVPCGISDFGVTSMKEIGKEISMEDFDEAFMRNFEKIFR